MAKKKRDKPIFIEHDGNRFVVEQRYLTAPGMAKVVWSAKERVWKLVTRFDDMYITVATLKKVEAK